MGGGFRGMRGEGGVNQRVSGKARGREVLTNE